METNPTVLKDTQKTIFLVDDDPSILKFVSGFLIDSNYRVITAGSGAEALQQSKGFIGGMLVLNEGWHFLAKPFVPRGAGFAGPNFQIPFR